MTGWSGRHVPSEDPTVLRVSRVVLRTAVLGPGVRAAVWVQRCDLRCGGCILPEGHGENGGVPVDVRALADALLEDPAIEGITLSGGEPFLQPLAGAALLAALRADRPELSTMAYTGYRLEWLRARRHPGTTALLERLDLLIDGPYVERLHAPLLWRGSRNQRLHALTPRHRDVLDRPDRSAGLELGLDADGAPALIGVPPGPRLRDRLEKLLGHIPPAGDGPVA